MTSVSFSLKNAINRDNNPTSDGLFAYGKYSQSNVFTLFTDYEYTDGSPLVLPTFDDTKVLAWKGSSAEYPHLGFENIQGNLNITPQPFPEYGIYLHPFYSTQRDDVGVRFNCPVTANVSVLSKLQKKDQECGDGIGYRILKNGGEAQTRQVYPASDNPHNITTNISVNKGDILDFIVDVGDNSNSFCDDVALEVLITVSYDKLSVPTITTEGISCETTEIEGFGYFIPANSVAVLCNGNVSIAYAPVSLIGSDYRSFFKFTNLDLSNFSGKQLKVVFKNNLIQDSEPANINLDSEVTCLTFVKPIIIEEKKCNKSYRKVTLYEVTSYKRTITAIANYLTKEIIATGFATTENDGTWSYNAIGEYRIQKEQLISISVPFGYTEEINFPSVFFNKSCTPSSDFSYSISGLVSGFERGIIVAYLFNSGESSLPVATAPINNSQFKLFITDDISYGNYSFYAIKLEF